MSRASHKKTQKFVNFFKNFPWKRLTDGKFVVH